MLKVDLHLHTKEDPEDKITYSAREAIDYAAKQKFDVLAFTSHNKVIHNRMLERYAKEKGILLIPGVEKTIERNHVLIYNLTEEESKKVNSFQGLEELKKEKERKGAPFLIVAAHPFYPGPTCLRNKIIKYFDLFDAWELSYFYTKLINPNKKTIKLAEKHKKPLVGFSDAHKLNYFGKNYSLVRAEKDLAAVFQAIKNNQIKIVTENLSFFCFAKVFFSVAFSAIKKNLFKQP